MKNYVGIILLFMLFGCGLLTNTTTTKRENKQLLKQNTTGKLLKQNDWLKEADSFTWYRDSANGNYAVQLWPKGVFTFSPDNGFSGEASSILITGNVLQTSNNAQLTHLREADKGKLRAELKTSDEQRNDLNNSSVKRSSSWKWIISACVLVILLWLILYFKFYK